MDGGARRALLRLSSMWAVRCTASVTEKRTLADFGGFMDEPFGSAVRQSRCGSGALGTR